MKPRFDSGTAWISKTSSSGIAPRRAIKRIVDEALRGMDGDFRIAYAHRGGSIGCAKPSAEGDVAADALHDSVEARALSPVEDGHAFQMVPGHDAG